MAKSTAVTAQGSKIEMGVADAAEVITDITETNPPVVTSAAHGRANGEVVKFAAVVGMTEINGMIGIVANAAANTFEAVGIDASAFTPYTSGGTATAVAAKVGNLKSFSGMDGSANVTDVTHMESDAKEKRKGLRDEGSFGFDVDFDNDNDGHKALMAGQDASEPSTFVLTLPNGKKATFSGVVKSFSLSGGVDDVLKRSAALDISGKVKWS